VSRAGASLYIHIPWCLSRCPYCDFNTYAAQTWPEEEYAAALVAELSFFCDRAPFRDAVLDTVFFGGGTPSLFAPATIERLLGEIAKRSPINADPEITLEANPGTVDRDRFAGFRGAGVNRLSIGIQSFQPRLLRALGRRHSVAESRIALDAARAAGFHNVSIDLIYAVPTQTLTELEADLAETLSFAPEHVSAYSLLYEPGTPLTRDLREGRVERASDELEATMFEAVHAHLAAAGYAQYEISNHARPGRAARHNQAYWRGGPYLGLGAGAHSFAPGAAPMAPEARDGVRWQNLREPGRYIAAVRDDGQAVDEHESLTRSQAMGEFCWLGLREARGISAGEFLARFGRDLAEVFPHVDGLRRDGLVEDRAGRLALSSRGLLVADSVFASFF